MTKKSGGPRKPPTRPSERPRVDWLSRALARSGVLTTKEAEDAIREGRVQVFGRVVRQPMAMVNPGDEVKVDGRLVPLRRQTRVLMFHKPAGVVSAPTDEHGVETVFSLLQQQLPPELQGYEWHAVGRLDRGTTGMLLFTNDERFVAHATSPQTHLPKRYVATVQGEPRESELDILRRGVELDDGLTRPAKLKLRSPGEVELTLTEGRNHQVKRMLQAIGFPVKALHREAVGKLSLDVEPGAWREVSEEEQLQSLGYGQLKS